MKTEIQCVAKDTSGFTLQRAIIPTEPETWDYASLLLFRDKRIKRVIFYNSWFTFINALSEPGYEKTRGESIEEEDKQALLTLREL